MTAEDILKKHFIEECKAGMFLTPEDETKVYAAMIEFAKMHVRLAFQTIDNEGIDSITSWSGNPYTREGSDSINMDKLIKIYPEKNIK